MVMVSEWVAFTRRPVIGNVKIGIDTMNASEPSVIPWSSETNWVIAHGSLEASITVESSDFSIAESDLEDSFPKSPLVLRPLGPDSGPCEIKIHFEQKFEIGQIYLRSTARVYEVYYANNPKHSNEYLCTVRCGVAERDEKILQITCTEDVVEGHGSRSLGELTGDSSTDGGNTANGEDDWVKVKAPEVGKSCLPNEIYTDRAENMQDLYEATAQISDADPCSTLMIRLLSLQDKGHVYVDEVYIFVDTPAESSDSRDEALLGGSSTQNSLMAVFVPTLLQLSKSGVSRARDKHTSSEVLKDDKTETGSGIVDQIDVGLQKHQIQQQYLESKELDKDTSELAELQPPAMAEKYPKPIDNNNLAPGNLESALEQLISRVSRLEDIFLRFEEKLLDPIKSIEARLQQVELQLEKLAQNSVYSDLPHCTRISAPALSCSQSNSGSFCNDQNDNRPCGPSELGKQDLSCNSMPESSHEANFHPGLLVCAPKFTCDEDEEDDDELMTLKDSPCIKAKKALSVDDALAAALDGFLSAAVIHPSEHDQTTSGRSSEIDEGHQYQELAESHEIKGQEFPAAESDDRESLRYSQILTVKAPDFNADGIDNEGHLNRALPSFSMASVIENEKDHDDDIVSPSQSKSLFNFAGACDFSKNKNTHDFELATIGDFAAVFIDAGGTYLGIGHSNESSEVNTMNSPFEGDNSGNPHPLETSNDSTSDLAKDSVKIDRSQIYDETNQGNTIGIKPDGEDVASKQVLELNSESVSEILDRCVAAERSLKPDTANTPKSSCASLLDFEFPILEVKFASDVYSSAKSPLEALLCGEADCNVEASSVCEHHDENGNTAICMDGNESTDPLPSSHLLVDIGVPATDGYPNLEEGSRNLSPSSTEMDASLI